VSTCRVRSRRRRQVKSPALRLHVLQGLDRTRQRSERRRHDLLEDRGHRARARAGGLRQERRARQEVAFYAEEGRGPASSAARARARPGGGDGREDGEELGPLDVAEALAVHGDPALGHERAGGLPNAESSAVTGAPARCLRRAWEGALQPRRERARRARRGDRRRFPRAQHEKRLGRAAERGRRTSSVGAAAIRTKREVFGRRVRPRAAATRAFH